MNFAASIVTREDIPPEIEAHLEITEGLFNSNIPEIGISKSDLISNLK